MLSKELLPLLLLGGDDVGTESSSSDTDDTTTTVFAPMLADALKNLVGRRVKLVLATSTLYPGGQLIIATIRRVLNDYVVIDHIEVNGVAVVDPSFLLLSTAQIFAVQPISRKEFFLELLWQVQAFSGRGTTTL